MTLQIEAFREARRIAAAEPLASMIERELMPGASCSSDAELELYLRAASDCAWHPVGTCRMGVGSDAVVDPDLRVHGLRNLRVADASVMPRITSGNTNAPTIMIAEKASRCVM
jgi:choline dehydrogenase